MSQWTDMPKEIREKLLSLGLLRPAIDTQIKSPESLKEELFADEERYCIQNEGDSWTEKKK